jgi:hypothetical protein
MRQAPLFEDHEQWFLRGRLVHVVPRSDGTGLTLRIRWSRKLGLQLDHVFVNHLAAQRKASQIELCGYIRPVYWKRIFKPRWTLQCLTISSN